MNVRRAPACNDATRPAPAARGRATLVGLAAAIAVATGAPALAQSPLDTARGFSASLLLPNARDDITLDVYDGQIAPDVASALVVQNTQSSAIIQLGSGNAAAVAVIGSPGTATSQTQIGSHNTSGVGVLGGAGNVVDVDQIGRALDSRVVLYNSYGVTVNHDQTATAKSGGVLILNGYPGLRIDLR